jgi:hypothetical protein
MQLCQYHGVNYSVTSGARSNSRLAVLSIGSSLRLVSSFWVDVEGNIMVTHHFSLPSNP